MKKFGIILLSVFIIVWAAFSYFAITQKLAEKRAEEAAKKRTEVQSKLEEFTVRPVLENTAENSGSIEIDTGSGKSEVELVDAEKVRMLSFTNARQCNRLTLLKEECKDRFVFNLAIKNNDIAYCESLKGEIEKNDCRDEVRYNLLQCADIKNTTLKQKCEYAQKQKQVLIAEQSAIQKADQTSDATPCKTVNGYSEKEQCIRNVVLKTKDISLCNKVLSDKDGQARCVKNLSYELNRAIISEAYETKNLSLCEKLTDETLKKQCKSMSF